MIDALISTSLFALANAFAGGKFKPILRQHGGPLPGRGIYYAAPVMGVALGALASDWRVGLAVLVGFLCYRVPGWADAIDGGTGGDGAWRDLAMMSARGLFFLPAFGYAAWTQQALTPIYVLLGVAVLAAYAYHFANNALGSKPWRFLALELTVGALWGLSLAGVFGLTG